MEITGAERQIIDDICDSQPGVNRVFLLMLILLWHKLLL